MLFGVFLMFLVVGGYSLAEACRIEEPANPSPRVFHKHISGECTLEERSALALPAEELLTALENGKNVDVLGFVVKGDLLFDQLPLFPIDQHPIPSSGVQEKLKERGIEEVRVIPGGITIRESWFEGILATNLRDGALVIFGQVDMDKTNFQKSLDFSKAVFLDSANFSDATIAYEAFFIGAHFDHQANFHGAAFGTHSRFHKAFFGKNATFKQTAFNGLAEFLEVVFAHDADFSQTIFRQGTGFSGTQFRGALDFSDALFEREAYFRFASVQKKASFSGATFQDVADFTNIQVMENPDFSNAAFEIVPIVGDSKINIENQRVRYFDQPTSQIGIFVGLSLLLLFFVWRLRRKGE